MPGGSSSTNQNSNQTSSSTSAPVVPTWLLNLTKGSGGAAQNLLNNAEPGLIGQLQPNPEQIAQLTPTEQSLIRQLTAESPGPFNPIGSIGNAQNLTGIGQMVLSGSTGPNVTAEIGQARRILQGLPGVSAGDLNSAERAIGDISNPQTTADLNAARDQIQQLTSGPIGSSPATQAAMRAYETSAVPQIESGQAMSGAGRGGGLTQALTQGEEQAYVPLVQQEIANRENAPAQYQGLATTQAELAQMQAAGYTNLAEFRNAQALSQAGGLQNLAQMGINRSMATSGAFSNLAGGAGNLASLESGLGTQAIPAAVMPQQTQQAQFEAAYQDLLRRYGLEQQAVLGPLEEFGNSLIGNQSQSISKGTTTYQPSVFDIFSQLGF